jgi:hypothetical protein
MKRLSAALFVFIPVLGGAATVFAQHEGHTMAPPPLQAPKPGPQAPVRRSERTRPPQKSLAEALEPIKMHFDRVFEWAGKIQLDFERLRTLDNQEELREAMRQHSLMLDQFRMMLIEHRALLRDQTSPAGSGESVPAEKSQPSPSLHDRHDRPVQEER